MRNLSRGTILDIYLLVVCTAVLVGCKGEVQPPPVKSARPSRTARPAKQPSPSKPAIQNAPSAPTASAPSFSALDYQLVTNLPLAHLMVGGGIVGDGSSTGFAKYLRDLDRRWALAVTFSGRPAALMPPRQAELFLPVGPELVGKPAVIEALIAPASKSRVTLYYSGKQLAEVELNGGWQQVRATIPSELIAQGITKVRLYTNRSRTVDGHRTSAAIRYIRLAPADAKPLPVAEQELSRALQRRKDARTLQLNDVDDGLAFHVTPAARLKLVGTVASGSLAISAQTDETPPTKLTDATGYFELALDPYAGKAVRLQLRATKPATQLTDAAIVGVNERPRASSNKPQVVIFWLIDALRPDKLDFYGPRGATRPKVKTPALSAVAREGVVFDPFWVNSNESKSSHASYFTGTYPAVHGVLNRPAKLRDSHVTIAEAFRNAGYRTAAFVSNGFISERWNYMQGFEQHRNFIREGKPNSAKAIVDQAIPWITRNKAERFYLYLGTSDTHVSYRVHQRFIDQYDPAPYNGPYRRFLSGAELGKIKGSKRSLPLRERQRIEAIYENEAAFNDLHFGRLVAHLKSLGLYDRALLIINSDHGEEFWEHGSCGHGHSLHRELVSVPFVLRLPGDLPAKQVTSGHDGVDLLPTLLSLIGQQPSAEVQGENLLPFISATAAYPRAMIATNEAGAAALQVGPAKVILRSAVSLRVYDVTKDPRERVNVYEKRPILTLAALDPLCLFVREQKGWRKTAWGTPNNLSAGYTQR